MASNKQSAIDGLAARIAAMPDKPRPDNRNASAELEWDPVTGQPVGAVVPNSHIGRWVIAALLLVAFAVGGVKVLSDSAANQYDEVGDSITGGP